MINELKQIFEVNKDKRICVLGTTCTGKSTLLKEIDGSDMDELIFPLLTLEETAYVNQDPWTPEVGEYMNNLVRNKLHIEKGQPLFGTVLLDCDLIVYLHIDDELLQERTSLRGANFQDAKNMQTSIEKEITESGIQCIKVNVISNLQRNLDALYKVVSRVDKPVTYVVSGSTSLAFQGVDIIPNDVDIFTNRDGVDYFYSILSDYTEEAPKIKETDVATSYYIKCNVDGVKVEVIGDFALKNNDGSYKESTINYGDVFLKEYNGLQIPVMSLQSELNGYEQLGRTDKVERIKQFIGRVK